MDSHSINVVLHVIGVAIGVGGATATYLVFLKAIKADHLSEHRFEAFEALSKMVWTGLAILIFSGTLALWLNQAEHQTSFIPSEKVWAKLFIVLILLVNGILMNLREVPLIRSWVGKKHLRREINKHRNLFFTTGAISLVSWYSALFLGAIGRLNYSFELIFGSYIVVVLISIIGAMVTAPYILKQSS